MQHIHNMIGQESQEPIKDYIELTTGSLLEEKERRRYLGRHLSSGAFLIVLPAGYRNHLDFFKRLTQVLRETGRDVQIHMI